MPDTSKSEKILDALQQLLNEKSIQHISPFTRMAMLFQACQKFSVAFLNQNYNAPSSIQDMAVLHQKYLNYVISELKPALTEIISLFHLVSIIHFRQKTNTFYMFSHRETIKRRTLLHLVAMAGEIFQIPCQCIWAT